jgi:hypothetical protein
MDDMKERKFLILPGLKLRPLASPTRSQSLYDYAIPVLKVKLFLNSIILLRIIAWRHKGKWKYNSTILELGTRWRWLVSFMPPLLSFWGKSSRYPLHRRLGGPQTWSRLYRERNNFLPLLEIEPPTSNSKGHCPFALLLRQKQSEKNSCLAIFFLAYVDPVRTSRGTGCLLGFIFGPQGVHLKLTLTFTGLHRAISQFISSFLPVFPGKAEQLDYYVIQQ